MAGRIGLIISYEVTERRLEGHCELKSFFTTKNLNHFIKWRKITLDCRKL